MDEGSRGKRGLRQGGMVAHATQKPFGLSHITPQTVRGFCGQKRLGVKRRIRFNARRRKLTWQVNLAGALGRCAWRAVESRFGQVNRPDTQFSWSFERFLPKTGPIKVFPQALCITGLHRTGWIDRIYQLPCGFFTCKSVSRAAKEALFRV